MAEWLGHWTYNPVVLGSNPPAFHSLDLFLVSLISTPWLGRVNRILEN